jgi:MFS family permease
MKSQFAAVFRSFSHRNFRLYFLGQGVSLIGTWMQQTAQPWLVYNLTGSPQMLGLVAACVQLPVFFLSPIAGVVSDRVDRRRLLIATQVVAMLQAFGLAVLVLTGLVQVWHVVVLSLLLGSVNAFDLSTRQAFLSEMLDRKEDLGNAIALNSVMFNAARVVGPALAGAMIALAGEGVCFLANALSFLAMLLALLAMRIEPREIAPPAGGVWHGLVEGVRYVAGSPALRTILATVSMISVTGISYVVLIPVFAKQVLHGDSHDLGFLMSAPGLGAVCSGLYLASKKNLHELLPRIAVTPTLIGLGLFGISFVDSLEWAMAGLFVVGFAAVLLLASCNTALQTLTAEDKRGRVLSLYAMAFLGTAPVGSAAAGGLSERLGVETTMRLGAAGCVLVSAFVVVQLPRLLPQVRETFAKKGLTAG